MPPRVTKQVATPPPRAAPRPTGNGQGVLGRVRAARKSTEGQSFLVYGEPGSGKCLGKGTPVLMYDGTVKNVEDVEAGDLLMGPDSSPRTVLTLGRGREKMYRVVPVKGDSWRCNASHILTLGGTGKIKDRVRDISVADYLKEQEEEVPNWERWKLLRSAGVDFDQEESLPFPPYLVGLWMGDGGRGTATLTNSKDEIVAYCEGVADKLGMFCRVTEDRNTKNISLTAREGSGPVPGGGGNPLKNFFRDRCAVGVLKTIPKEYLTASRKQRKELLAAIIDTDGEDCRSPCTMVTVTGEPYRDALLFLCRSLGLGAYCVQTKVHTCGSGKVSTYYRVSISGDLHGLPTRVRKFSARKSPKRVTVTGFELEEEGEDDYYGFTLDGDGRFLLGDFTITHNTCFWATFPRPILAVLCSGVLKPNDLDSLSEEELEGIDTLVVEKVQDVADLAREMVSSGAEYATVVLDHCTGFQDLVLAEKIGMTLANLPVQKHFGLATKEDWGIISGKFKTVVKPLLNLTCNRVFVCHEKLDTPRDEDKNSELARTWIRYNLSPQIGSWLAGAVNNVCRMSKEPRMVQVTTDVLGEKSTSWVREKGMDFCLRTGEHDFFASKVRKPRSVQVQEYLRDPTYDKFIRAVRGEPVA